jgi:hypothetical protein
MQAADFLAVESHVQGVSKALAARLFSAGPGCQLTGQEVNYEVLFPFVDCWFQQLADEIGHPQNASSDVFCHEVISLCLACKGKLAC